MPGPNDDNPHAIEPIPPVTDDPQPPVTGVFLGPGLAYENVSLTSAMVVQDAAGLMRQIGMVSTAALAVITEKIVETTPSGGEAPWVKAFGEVTKNLTDMVTYFNTVGVAAANVLSYFQPGSKPPPWPPKSSPSD